MAEKISSFLLEKYLLGECTEGDRQRVESAMAADPALARKVKAMGDADAAFLSAHPPESVVPEIKARAAAKAGTRWWFYLTPALTLSVAAVVATAWYMRPVVVAPGPSNPSNPSTSIPVPTVTGTPWSDGYRSKGSETLTVYFQAAGGSAIPLTNGETLPGPGSLQVIFRIEKAPYGIVFSTDPKGELTWHYPARFPAVVPKVDPAIPQAVKDAYELDGVTPWERFVLLSFEKAPSSSELESVLAPFKKPGAMPVTDVTVPAGVRATCAVVRQNVK